MKKHGIRLLSILLTAMLCLFGTGYFTKARESGADMQTNAAASSPVPAQRVLACKHYNTKDFMVSITSGSGTAADKQEARPAGKIKGGIVPHHLLAGNMIASIFKALSEDDPSTIVLIGPNHKRIGHNSLITSKLAWSTDFGILENDTAVSNWLISDRKAAQNNSLMEEEHSVSSLIPYIKYYMPKAKVVPLLLHGDYTAAESGELGRQLAEKLSSTSDAVVMASVDFSHYLDAITADKMDEKTIAAIKAFDMDSISRMGNDNLDSPPSILVLLSAMKEMGADVLEVTGHDNSSDIAGKGADFTTSYYTAFFRHYSR